MLQILVFVVLLEPLQVIGSSCSYESISRKYKESCKREEYLNKLFDGLDNDGEVTSDEVLERLTSTCSKYEKYSKCARCAAKKVCIEEQDKLQEVLIEKWSIFCDADQPASWLVTILQNGFSYNKTCSYVYMPTILGCIPQDRSESSSNETSLTGLAGVYRGMIEDLFSCLVSGILKRGNEGCGSSWQDVVLQTFLLASSKYGLLFNINQDEITQLQTMRC